MCKYEIMTFYSNQQVISLCKDKYLTNTKKHLKLIKYIFKIIKQVLIGAQYYKRIRVVDIPPRATLTFTYALFLV